VNIGQTVITPTVAEHQLLVIQSRKMQHGRVQIVVVHLILDRTGAVVVGRAVADTTLHARNQREEFAGVSSTRSQTC